MDLQHFILLPDRLIKKVAQSNGTQLSHSKMDERETIPTCLTMEVLT